MKKLQGQGITALLSGLFSKLVVCLSDTNSFYWKYHECRKRRQRHQRKSDFCQTGIRVFIAGINGATCVAPISGSSGTSNDMPWRDKDEDLMDYSRRVMRYAHAKCL